MNPKSQNIDRRELLKQAYLKIQALQKQLEEKNQSSFSEPIAVIGMGCRFPAGANDAYSFWNILKNGTDTVSEIPPERWDMDAYFDPDTEEPGKIYTRCAAVLKDIDQFDHHFFGVSPREASKMDPQQRLLLEVGWEALENAGQASDRLSGSATGVFMALNGDDYAHLMSRTAGTDAIDLYFGTGVARSIAAGRLSYVFGLKGPCLSLDTACSGSLVAVHLACQSLRMKECRMAMAGGVTLIITPDGHIIGSNGKMLSRQGRCKTFDDSADGYVRGEGCGIIILKRLSDAIADRDNILAVIRGTALNQDGRSGGMTAPSGPAQEEVIGKALEDADMAPGDIAYVETHGTGTILGDPIEVQALGNAYGQHHSTDEPLYIGAVKTNVGHLEAAAGIAGLIKALLILQHGEIPPNLHFKTPNSHVPWEQLSIRVPTQLTAWPAYAKKRIVGVSSFGFSGTNSHIIMEAAPENAEQKTKFERPLHLLALSAKNTKALDQLVLRYISHLEHHPELSIGSVCFSANSGRQHQGHRLAVIGSNLSELKSSLSAFRDNGLANDVIQGEITGSQLTPVAFLFTGQGAQYLGMGQSLYQTQPVFRRTMDHCNELLLPYLKTSLLSILYPSPGSAPEAQKMLKQTAFTQPAMFAFEYSLYTLWKSWGIEPSALMGHSVGEYVAACVAGVFSLQEGLMLIAERGKMMQELDHPGKMAAIFENDTVVADAIRPFESTIAIAAVNGPENTVISGDARGVDQVLQAFESKGVRYQSLNVSHAFHSPLMDPILDKFQQTAARVQYAAAQIDVVSNVTGTLVDRRQMASAAYWIRHLRSPVLYRDSIQKLYDEGYRILLEVGPHPTLLGMASTCLEGSGTIMLPSLRRGRDDWRQILRTLGRLYVQGAGIDWERYDKEFLRRKLPLPTYPFNRERFWVKSPDKSVHVPDQGPVIHPLLHRRIHSPKIEDVILETVLDMTVLSYLKEHQLFSTVVVPATVYLEMGMAAAGYLFGKRRYGMEDFNIFEPLFLDQGKQPTLQIILSASGSHQWEFEIYSCSEQVTGRELKWRLHANGRLGSIVEPTRDLQPKIGADEKAQMESGCPVNLSGVWYYDMLNAMGVEYGPTFQGLEHIHQGDGEVIGEIRIPDGLDSETELYHLHPALLDACFQVLGIALYGDDQSANRQNVYLPMGLEQYRVYQRGQNAAWCHGTIRSSLEENAETFVGDVQVFGHDGGILAEIIGLRFKRADKKSLRRLNARDLYDWLYKLEWHALEELAPEADSTGNSGTWLIFSDRNGLGGFLADGIRKNGATVHMIQPGECYDASSLDDTLIRPCVQEDYESMLKRVSAAADQRVRGIIHLWSLAIEAPVHGSPLPLPNEDLGWTSILNLVKALPTATWKGPAQLTIVTAGAMAAGIQADPVNAFQSLIWGLGRVIASERPELQSKIIDIEPSLRDGAPPQVLLDEIISSQRSENQVALRQGERFGLRLVKVGGQPEPFRQGMQESGDRPYQLVIPKQGRGVIENLELRPADVRLPAEGEVQIEIDATGLNFRDVLNTLDMYPGEPGPLGNECVGRISALGAGVHNFKVGEPVLAITPQAFCTYVNAHADLVVRKPASISVEEAATIPMTFLTAHYALNHVGRMRSGDRVLIHAAAGGVGMAALQLAQQKGAEIYATAGNPRKRELIRSMGVSHVMDSRTLNFADQILEATNGQGVDIVLNALAGDFIPKGLSILNKGGRFLELGKTDLWDKEKAERLYPDIIYSTVFLGDVCLNDSKLVRSMFKELMQGMQDGGLKPLPHHTFSIYEAETAFRFMAQAKHIGKIVIDQRTMDERPFIRSDSTYIITGGTGGLGLSFARSLVAGGAKHLVLYSRKPAPEKSQKIIRLLEAEGAQITLAQGDVAKESDLRQMLTQAGSQLPVRGIIHAAGVIDDAVLMNQDVHRFVNVLKPKVTGAWLLHTLTSNLDLDFFVMCSAGAALFGSPGQGNYAAANAFMDGLAYYRQSVGLPALSINWGPWSTIGMAAALNKREQKRWASMGMGMIEPKQGVLALELALRQNTSQIAVLPIDWSIYLRQFVEGEAPIFLSEIARDVHFLTEAGPSSDEANALHRILQEADPEDRRDLLQNHVREQIINALGLKPSMELKLDQGLTDMGMDSLMAVEISNRLKRSLGCSLPSTLAFEYPTLEALTDYLAMEVLETKSSGNEREEIDNETVAQLQVKKRVEDLSEKEVEKTLLKELEDTGY
jgi:acyl transferase domain-containing protein/NADPH:quinone reductase-like Zn-dependent oxidoreductase/NAD(P)-dependent dehydrogenase (short-subunit alcohol dehydrogenase family)/acyl carrier protein